MSLVNPGQAGGLQSLQRVGSEMCNISTFDLQLVFNMQEYNSMNNSRLASRSASETYELVE